MRWIETTSLLASLVICVAMLGSAAGLPMSHWLDMAAEHTMQPAEDQPLSEPALTIENDPALNADQRQARVGIR